MLKAKTKRRKRRTYTPLSWNRVNKSIFWRNERGPYRYSYNKPYRFPAIVLRFHPTSNHRDACTFCMIITKWDKRGNEYYVLHNVMGWRLYNNDPVQKHARDIIIHKKYKCLHLAKRQAIRLLHDFINKCGPNYWETH